MSVRNARTPKGSTLWDAVIYALGKGWRTAIGLALLLVIIFGGFEGVGYGPTDLLVK